MTDEERKKRNQKIRKMITEFDANFSLMSETDQKAFAESWLRKINYDGTEPI